MTDSDGTESGAALSTRVALLSILGFWLFYFLIVTVRSAVLGLSEFGEGLVRRSIVAGVSAAVTLLLYLVLRRLPRRSLALGIMVAALLSVPAAALYSTVNWFAFRAVSEREATVKKRRSTRVIVIEGPDGASVPAPPPVPPARAVATPPPPPPRPSDVNRRIMVQVGDATEEEHLSPLMEIADNAANGYFFIATWAALYLALSYAAEVRVAERQAARFRAAAQAAEIRALRYQVNPHFLFNTLNSLSSLVMTGKAAQAERMIMNLATFFRTSLTGDPGEDVRLSDEIRLQRLYLDIEAVRFPDRLVAAIDVPEALEAARVPGLILQPLVENAIKHGVSRAGRPVSVRIAARTEDGRLVLSVTDDGPMTDPLSPPLDPARRAAAGSAPSNPAGLSQEGTGVGLRNVSERLSARFGSAAGVRFGPGAAGGFEVTLFMPLVHADD